MLLLRCFVDSDSTHQSTPESFVVGQDSLSIGLDKSKQTVVPVIHSILATSSALFSQKDIPPDTGTTEVRGV
jgi:hypothetical protein